MAGADGEKQDAVSLGAGGRDGSDGRGSRANGRSATAVIGAAQERERRAPGTQQQLCTRATRAVLPSRDVRLRRHLSSAPRSAVAVAAAAAARRREQGDL